METVKFIGRLVWLPIASALALLTGAAVLLLIGHERIVAWLSARSGQGDQVLDAIEIARQTMAVVLSLASGLTLLLALGVVIVGEVARIRSALYYVVGGGIAIGAIPFLAKWTEASGVKTGAPPTVIWMIFATAGFATGLVYWLLAGRRA